MEHDTLRPSRRARSSRRPFFRPAASPADRLAHGEASRTAAGLRPCRPLWRGAGTGLVPRASSSPARARRPCRSAAFTLPGACPDPAAARAHAAAVPRRVPPGCSAPSLSPGPAARPKPRDCLHRRRRPTADFPVLQPEREHPVDPASFALPEPKAWHRSLWPPPSPPPRSAGERVPPRLPPAPGPTAEARFPQPLPRPPAPLPLPPRASSPARASEAVPALPHPWPALPARPDPPAPPATGRWAEPLPDQERRGWSA